MLLLCLISGVFRMCEKGPSGSGNGSPSVGSTGKALVRGLSPEAEAFC